MKYRIGMKAGNGFETELEDKDILCKIVSEVNKGCKIITISNELIINIDELAFIVRI
jgi:hypothetical protein